MQTELNIITIWYIICKYCNLYQVLSIIQNIIESFSRIFIYSEIILPCSLECNITKCNAFAVVFCASQVNPKDLVVC